jgi:hypothetical protein
MFSLRDWQKDALIRLLTAPTGSAGAGSSASSSSASSPAWSDDWKVLVYDAHARAVLSPLLSVGELRACGVTLHLSLEAARDALPDVSAMCVAAARSPAPRAPPGLAHDRARASPPLPHAAT